jgi:uncharacterized membrane protein (DUF485 family)
MGPVVQTFTGYASAGYTGQSGRRRPVGPAPEQHRLDTSPLNTQNTFEPLPGDGERPNVCWERGIEIWRGDMLHEPVAEHGADHAAEYKKRLGLIMLAVYGVIYLAFIIINVAKPKVMGTMVVGGLNLAIIYGFALIVIAFVLAIAYNWACTRHEKSLEAEEKA